MQHTQDHPKPPNVISNEEMTQSMYSALWYMLSPDAQLLGRVPRQKETHAHLWASLAAVGILCGEWKHFLSLDLFLAVHSPQQNQMWTVHHLLKGPAL